MESFAGKIFLDKLAEALWDGGEYGRASVMVGAGFSLNAKPTSAGASNFPLWGDIVKALVAELEPFGIVDGPPYGTSDALKLASLYEQAFGRNKLDEFIIRIIPDSENKPGSTHKKLLNLPWCDVFTTNYDTLLERTSQLLPFRRYFPVRTPQDLTNSRRPRIVKLHGSLPSNRPFTITEEDFRRYPTDYAPFVNTVRQSLMENIFCLVGFSGDDPNFIKWSGWVRDFLSPHTPNIYLLGVFDFTAAERKYLQNRRITPVDLGPLVPPQSRNRHKKALLSAFEYLEDAKPQDPIDWPHPTATDVQTRHTSHTPPEKYGRPDNEIDELRRIRDEYPGWLVTPLRIRTKLSKSEQKLREQVLNAKPDAGVPLLRELAWLQQRRLRPLSHDEAKTWCEILNTYVTQQDSKPRIRETDPDLQLISLCIIELIRMFRENQMSDQFDRWKVILENSRDLPNVIKSQLAYESCLYHLVRCEFDELRSSLDDWPVTNNIYDKIRRAMFYIEVGDTSEGLQLAQEALNEIRLVTEGTKDVYHLSREGWGMYFIDIIKLQHPRSMQYDRNTKLERWDRLEGMKCNPWSEINKLERKCERTEFGGASKRPGFFPGVTKHTIGYKAGGGLTPLLQYLRLIDDVAIPIGIANVKVIPDQVYSKLVAAASAAPYWLFGTLIREGNSNQLDSWLSRVRLAAMPQDWFNWLMKVSIRLLEFCVVGAKKDNEHFRRKLSFSLKLATRLSTRATHDVRSKLFELGKEVLKSESMQLADLSALEEFFRGLLESADKQWLSSSLTKVLSLNLEEDGIPSFMLDYWEEPINFLPRTRVKAAASDQMECRLRDHGTIEWLLEMLSEQEEIARREIALARLWLIQFSGMLNNEETEEFRTRLWAHREEDSEVPLGVQGFSLIVLLDIPPPQELEVEEQVVLRGVLVEPPLPKPGTNSEWLGKEMYWIKAAKARLRNLESIASQQSNESFLGMDNLALQEFLHRLATWMNEIVNSDEAEHALPGSVAGLFRPLGNFLMHVMAETEASSRMLNSVVRIRRGMKEISGRSLGHTLTPALLIANSSADFSTEVSELKDGLLSGSNKGVYSACNGLVWWCRLAAKELVEPVPPNLLEELAERIRQRRSPGLAIAINAAAEVVRKWPDLISEEALEAILVGLSRLAEESAMTSDEIWPQPGEQNSATFVVPRDERPTVRWRAAELAMTVVEAELSHESMGDILDTWIDICQTDPLPEVRRAYSPKFNG